MAVDVQAQLVRLGSGGREHALAWKLAQSRLLSGESDTLYAAPGNPGIAQHAVLTALDATDHEAVLRFCEGKRIGLVVIGPEAPLVDGLADTLRGHGFNVFGPSQAAAQLEGSKGFTKDLCQRAGIPTAGYVRTTSLKAATAALENFTPPYVLKANGLAAGKGVVIAESREEAEAALAEMFGGQFGDAGAEVVIEEFMEGEEVSFFALTDGASVLSFGSAQDHKRVGDGDTGPNTGGMGAYSPAPVVTPAVHQRAMDEVILPTLRGMAADGIPYTGFLYAGLMITPGGRVKTLEFNCRMGDPETQPIMMRLKSNLAQVLLSATRAELDKVTLDWDPRVALGVVLAAAGYPMNPRKGDAITGLPDDGADRMVFHAGTSAVDGRIEVSGGRVLCVTALADSVAAAREKAYAVVDQIRFDGMQCRRDIGFRAL